MKSRLYHILLVALFAVFFTACNWLDSKEVEVSSSAHFRSLSFTNAVAADANVKKARFQVIYDAALRDSIIVNVDSLPYNTAIDSVIPAFSFYSMNGTIVYRNDATGAFKDSIYLTGKDTLDFRRVFKVKNLATDGKTSVTYRIKVNVHTLDPDLLQWKRVNSLVSADLGTMQKAIYLKNEIYLFSNAEAETSLTKSLDGVVWSAKAAITDLPTNVSLQNTVVFKDSIYIVHTDNSIFKSANGIDWKKTSYQAKEYVFKNLLYDFKSMLWAIVQSKSDSKYRFAKSNDGLVWTVDPLAVLDSNFPVSGFAAVSFKSRTNLPKVVVAGGFDKDGSILSSVWSSTDGMYWVNFSADNKTFGSRSGISMIYYEDKLLCFGGVDQYSNQVSNLFLQSRDEGLSWKAADSLMWVREKLIDGKYRVYERRYNQAVVVDKNNFIHLIGGRDSAANHFKDVWRGRLNRSIFIIK